MGNSTVVKKVENLAKRKPKISQPGRLLPHLQQELGGRYSRDQIADALDALNDTGTIKLDKCSSNYNGFDYVRPEDRRSKSDYSPESKRQHMFAKGIPAHLSDDMCTPVVVRYKEGFGPSAEEAPAAELNHEEVSDPPTDENEEIVTEQESQEMRVVTIDNLNLALMALREKCDDNGILQAKSSKNVIRDALGLSDSQATSLNTTLGWMGFKSMGKGYRPVKVEFEPEFVTGEHLASTADRRKRQDEEATPVPVAEPEPIIEETSQEVAPSVPTQDPYALIRELTAIVTSLESQMEFERSVTNGVVEERDRLLVTNAALIQERDRLLEINAAHMATERDEEVVSTAASIVERYSSNR